VRASLNLQAQQREVVAREDSASSSGDSPLPAARSEDPELGFLKRHYRADFKAALEAAICALEPGQRALLREHFLEGLSIDELGRRHNVHRSTAARWVVRGREALLEGMRAQLMRRLSVSAPELDSLMGLMRSQLDVSLGGLLRNAGD
jgi:RNA polymerase sigma-70 factor (ECF subfamily)